MATTSYIIYSHYDPKTSRNPIISSGGGDSFDSWQFDPALKPPPPPPPRFVPVSLPSPGVDDGQTTHPPKQSPSGDISSWYRSLTTENPDNQAKPPLTIQVAHPNKTSPAPNPRLREKKNKNNWFIMNVVQSDPTASSSSAPSLAEMIARDPPPLPTSRKYEPPVWLAIGPSNRGFAMMERSGWSEGETLGSEACQLTVTTPDESEPGPSSHSNAKSDRRNVSSGPCRHSGSRDRIALLRPIATKLKSDRLGIGLKARTIGPYKASQKRITHNTAALVAHAKAAEESRRQRYTYGRGRRGLAARKRKDEQDRRNVLAYLNS